MSCQASACLNFWTLLLALSCTPGKLHYVPERQGQPCAGLGAVGEGSEESVFTNILHQNVLFR